MTPAVGAMSVDIDGVCGHCASAIRHGILIGSGMPEHRPGQHWLDVITGLEKIEAAVLWQRRRDLAMI